MNAYRRQLAINIIRDHFGPVGEEVFSVLVNRGALTFSELQRAVSSQAAAASSSSGATPRAPLPPDALRKTLCVLIQHLCVHSQQGISHVKYRAACDAAVRRLLFPQFVARVEAALGRHAGMALEVVLENGVATTDRIVAVFADRCAAEEAMRVPVSEEADAAAAARSRFEEAARRAIRLIAGARFITRATPTVVEHIDAPEELRAGMPASKRKREDAADKAKAKRKRKKKEGEEGEEGAGGDGKRKRGGEEEEAEEESDDQKRKKRSSKKKKKPGEDEELEVPLIEPRALTGEAIPRDLMALAGIVVPEGAPAPPVAAAAAAATAATATTTTGQLAGAFEGVLDIPAAPATEAMTEASGMALDGDTLWRANFDEFAKEAREEAMIKWVDEKVDVIAGKIVRVILRMTRGGAESVDKGTLIAEILSQKLPIDERNASLMLEIMAKDKSQILSMRTTGGAGGRTVYAAEVANVMEAVRQRHIDSILSCKFGQHGMRVYRLLCAKKFLEEKQVAEQAMLDMQETHIKLSEMLDAGYVSFQEFPRSSGPREVKTSIFLWTVNQNRTLEIIKAEVDHAILNLRARVAHELDKVSSLVERAQAELDHGPGSPSLLTDEERTKLQKFLSCQDRIELSVINLAEVAQFLSN